MRVWDSTAEIRYLVIPEAYHEILMETDGVRAQFWAAFDALTTQVLAAEVIPAKAEAATSPTA